MRITELLEGKEFDDLEFVKKDGDKEGIDYDLVEDLMYFMNHDDDAYRRHVYPAITDCVDRINSNRKTTPAIFKNAVEECYKSYIQKFPIRDLKDSLEDDLFSDTCNKMYKEVCNNVKEGKYKD